MDLYAAATAEVIARHAFFVNWFTGRCDAPEMDSSARAFAPDMLMISPDGSMATAPQVVAMLQSARASRDPDFAIQIEVVATQPLGDLALVIYDEHQQTRGVKTQRRSSALFSPDSQAPQGVVWRHLHETWT